MRILSGLAAIARVRKLAARRTELVSVEPKVRRIVNAVRRDGDAALRRYARKWDGVGGNEPLRVPEAQIETAWTMADPKLRKSLQHAAANIRRFCSWQRPREWSRSGNGLSLGQLIRPLDSVGCYVPAGRHPLVSTVLMTVIPAQVAEVPNLRIVTPRPSPELLAAAGMLGVREVYRIGGAHAIAALAYGTHTVPRVDKIVGPGNTYVTAAKKLISFDCAIDFLAGPTEAVILAERGRAEFLAADLVAQAEHDPDAMAVFITTSKKLARNVSRLCLEMAAANATALQSLKQHGCALHASSRDEALNWANEIAPEHITVEPQSLPFIRNAGSIFVGDYSAQAAGDYATGPNHVLPTAGVARWRGGLSVLDFLKLITVQQLCAQGLDRLANTVTYLAEAEGLPGHANSIRVRCSRA